MIDNASVYTVISRSMEVRVQDIEKKRLCGLPAGEEQTESGLDQPEPPPTGKRTVAVVVEVDPGKHRVAHK